MSPSNFSHKPFDKVQHPADEPVLPEHTDLGTKRGSVRFDHAKGAVEAPCEEEGKEKVMCVPKSLVVLLSGFFDGGEDHGH